MNDIVVLGDLDTVTAFRAGGIEGMVASSETVGRLMDSIIERGDVFILLITRSISGSISDIIHEINLNRSYPVILEIPGVEEREGFGTTLMEHITRALGISI